MSEFTEAPWTICKHSWSDTSIYSVNDSVVCRISIEDIATEETQDDLEIEADKVANLIAAAPELYAELHKIVTAESTDEIYAQLKSARLVLAKARGE